MSDAVVEEVRARADLVELCGEFMRLKRVGKSWRGPCPLHGGEDPNFAVDPDRGLFKCFVCGEGGDVFSFVMKHLGRDFPEAVRWLAERYGIHVPEEAGEREDPHAGLREAVAFAGEWFRGRLEDAESGATARRYLEGRGVDPETSERFGLGWAPDEWRALREAAANRGIAEATLLEAGLLATSEKADEPYDRFRGRLVFPIRDLRSRPVAFGGRDLTGREGAPKYINSPESPIFRKGETLYALERARHEIRRRERSLVVEGYMDVVSLHRHGWEEAVAPLGTALAPRQAATLVRYARKVYLLFDSDAAGLRATFRAGDAVLAAGGEPMVVTLPEGEDPDSLLRERGPEALEARLEDAVDVLERKLQILERRGLLATIEGRRRAVDGLLGTLRAAADPALRDLYLSRAAEALGLRRETLEEQARRAAPRAAPSTAAGGSRDGARSGPSSRGRRPGASDGGSGSRFPPDGEETAERTLLLLLLRDDRGGLLEEADRAGLRPEHFRDGTNAALYEALHEARREGRHGDWASFFEGETLERAGRLLGDATELTDPGRIFEHSLRRVLHREELERLDELRRELARGGGTDEQRDRELLREIERLAAGLRAAGVSLSFVRRYKRGGSGTRTWDEERG